MEYEVVEQYSISQLKERVRYLTDKGFVCQGGIAVYFKDNGSLSVYVQAMVKKEVLVCKPYSENSSVELHR